MQYISLILIALINTFFSYKYIQRYFDHALLLAFLVGMMTVAFPLIIEKIELNYRKINRGLLLAILIASPLYLYLISFYDPMMINVDRWSVITSFWDAWFEGKYSYNASSHLGNMPGPFPGLFLLTFPFYLFGNLSLVPLTAIWLFLALMYFKTSMNSCRLTQGIFLLFVSTPILWELIVRSNILYNSVFVIGFLLWLLHSKKEGSRMQLVIGCVGGFILSTRGIFIIPYILVLTFWLKSRERKLSDVIYLGTGLIFGFIISFLPFIIGNWEEFIHQNPITLQSTHFMPFWFSLAFIIISLIAGYFIRKNQIFIGSGSILFLTVIVYFIYSMQHYGQEAAYIGSKMDVSYTLFALPFFILDYISSN